MKHDTWDQNEPRHVNFVARGNFDKVWLAQELKGKAKYGTPLTIFNGRFAYRDAMEEAVDLINYVTQMEMERQQIEKAFLLLWERACAMDPEQSFAKENPGIHDIYENLRGREAVEAPVQESAQQRD